MSVSNSSNNIGNNQKNKKSLISVTIVLFILLVITLLFYLSLTYFQSELTPIEETLNCDGLFHLKIGAKLQ